MPNPERNASRIFRMRNVAASTIRNMKEIKEVLWKNVSALMHAKWGDDNLQQLAREAGVGVASVKRIKDQSTSIGVDIIAAIAEYFGCEPWQLLFPDLDAGQPMKLPSDKERRIWLQTYDKLTDKRRRKILDMAEEFLSIESHTKESGNSR